MEDRETEREKKGDRETERERKEDRETERDDKGKDCIERDRQREKGKEEIYMRNLKVESFPV